MIKNRKLRNATLIVLIVSLLVSLLAFPVNAVEEYDFANFTEADSMAFIEDNNIEIPSNLQQLDYLPEFTRELILQSYQTPNTPFCFNFIETLSYAEEIRLTVGNYLDLAAIPMTAAATSYSLLYNKVQDANGNWVSSGGVFNPKWENYNCYAFSINRAEQPHFYNTGKQYQPGDMGGTGYFRDGLTVDGLAEIIRADLIAMGYSNVSLSSSIPTINSSQELICVRIKHNVDYHFMRYDIETNAWYHKPGLMAVMKYNYVPTNDRLWYTEYFDDEGAHPSSFDYDSSIVYISYSKNQITLGQNNTSREYIQPEKDVFCELTVSGAGHYDIDLNSPYSFEYQIYDDEFDVVSFGTGTSFDICLTASSAGKYYLRMNFVSYTGLSYVDVAAVSHSHLYNNSFRWISTSQHRSTCCCGSSIISAHVVPAGSFTGSNPSAICLDCGGMATSGAIVMSIDDMPRSDNGSYILPNGIIVLQPEDMDAYRNGTLVFRTGEIE